MWIWLLAATVVSGLLISFGRKETNKLIKFQDGVRKLYYDELITRDELLLRMHSGRFQMATLWVTIAFCVVVMYGMIIVTHVNF